MKDPRDIAPQGAGLDETSPALYPGASPEVSDAELERVDALLAGLPTVEPKASLVRQTLARIEGKTARPTRHRAAWLTGILAASGTLATAALVMVGVRRADEAPTAAARDSLVAGVEQKLTDEENVSKVDLPEAPPPPPVGYFDRQQDLSTGVDDGKAVVAGRYRAELGRGESEGLRGVSDRVEVDGNADRDGADTGGEAVTLAWKNARVDGGGGAAADPVSELGPTGKLGILGAEQQPDQGVSGEGVKADNVERELAGLLDGRDGQAAREPALADANALFPARRVPAADDAGDAPAPEQPMFETTIAGELRAGKDAQRRPASGWSAATTTVAAERAQGGDDLEETAENEKDKDKDKSRDDMTGSDAEQTATITRGLASVTNQVPAFIEARGYFANTYLPGGAELSWLRAQARGVLGSDSDGRRLEVEDLIEPVAQPFDAPRSGALGLSLASDVAALSGSDGPRRMTLQLGLKGARQAPTRRSALNLALVVDVAGISDDAERRALWALAEALARQALPEDRLSLVLHTGGAPTTMTVAPGEVTRVLAEAYAARGGDRPLADAMSAAYAAVRRGVREDAAMGSELVVLATSGLATGADAGLSERAHGEALRGVHLSTIGVGSRVDLGALRALALAGQGRASHVAGSAEASTAVGAELGAAGRAVARAVRLRVRLGDGVQLVSVLGSRRLDEVDADKVRAVERRIDQEVARHTGISADRGADEDGIQIVIPAFLAGDDHVILFDVVVNKPGLVMDVRARFKDLVTLGNGEVSASLTIPSGPSGSSGRHAPRAEQRNVTRNLAARRTSDALGHAARLLAAGDVSGARRALAEGRAEVERIAEASGLVNDPSLRSDRRALMVFETAVAERGAGPERSALSSSLQLASALELGRR